MIDGKFIYALIDECIDGKLMNYNEIDNEINSYIVLIVCEISICWSVDLKLSLFDN